MLNVKIKGKSISKSEYKLKTELFRQPVTQLT